MSERDEERAADRLERVVSSLLAGRRLQPGRVDRTEAVAIKAAGLFAGAVGDARMPAGLRRRLTRMLEPVGPAVSRRAALVAGLGIAVGVAAGAGGEFLAGQRAPIGRHPAASRAVLEPGPPNAAWVDTGLSPEELADGVPYRVSAGSVDAFVIRRGGRLVAMSAYCTDLPCALVWRGDQRALVCPCHGQHFNLDGDPVGGWPLPPLPLIRVRVTDGRVEVLGTS